MSDQTPPVAPKSLAYKLAEVMAAVERIPKNGRNTFHGYNYATEADIVFAIRQELASRHVILIPSVLDVAREAVGEKGSFLTTLRMSFKFVDGETNESIARPWIGCGSDKDDKGVYKAMTGGEKYFLLKTFLVPTGDDPEADKPKEDASHSARRSNQGGRAATGDSTPPVRPTSPAPASGPPSGREAAPTNGAPALMRSVKSIVARARELGWEDAEISQRAKQEFSKGLTSLTAAELQRLGDIIETGEDVADGAH